MKTPMSFASVAACSLIIGFSSFARAQTPALEFKELAEDTKLTTPSGATFTVARGWRVARANGLIVIEEPQRELAAAFVEASAPTVEEAIARAWERWRPDFARTIRQTVKPPASQGWDEIAQIAYETSADERRVVTAVARRKGTTYYVTLIDGGLAAAERRGAQLNIAIGSLEVAARTEENLSGRKAHLLDAARAEQLIAFAESAREKAKIPGVALAVVQNGRIVLERGLGVRALGASDPVTPTTLFMIGSMTKPLTSLMMARLVDAKRFSWDTPITTLMPSFALADPDVTRRVTMAHTVCACTGLPRWDMEFIFEWSGSNPQSRIDLLRAMMPTTGFGETFQYSNLMVASGGYVSAMTAARTKDLRQAYDEVMRSEVLGPLGMTATALDLDAAVTREHAKPHSRTLTFDAALIPTETERGVDSVMPAGGAWSNVRDLSRWLLLELGNGKLNGKQIVSEANLRERRKPRVKINARSSYALALMVDESRGLTSIGHGGNTFGFSADAVFFPEHDTALVVLTNAQAANAYLNAVRRKLVELLLDAQPEAEKNFAFGLTQLAESIKKQMQEITLTPDPAFLQPWTGAWTNPRLGTVTIRREGTAFTLDAGEWKAPIGEHRDPTGTRRIILTGPPFAGMTFWPQQTDARATLLFETAQQKYLFERAPGTASAQPSGEPRMTAAERAELIELLTTSEAEMMQYIAGLSDAQWAFKPAPDRWSVGEVVEHIVLAEGLMFDLAVKSVDGQPDSRWEQTLAKTAILKSALPNRSRRVDAPGIIQPKGRMTREAALARFTQQRARIGAYARDTDRPLKAHTSPNPFFGDLNAHQWLLYVPLHTMRHNQQIAEVKATPSFPK
jgi:CubicO group peptidase (beta-lactamase class C family)